jgi:hypothetical protein
MIELILLGSSIILIGYFINKQNIVNENKTIPDDENMIKPIINDNTSQSIEIKEVEKPKPKEKEEETTKTSESKINDYENNIVVDM